MLYYIAFCHFNWIQSGNLFICFFLVTKKFYLPVIRITNTGYEWVGWRNDSLGLAGKPVEMTFEFDSVRNFSSIILHTNNMFSKDVAVSLHLYIFFVLLWKFSFFLISSCCCHFSSFRSTLYPEWWAMLKKLEKMEHFDRNLNYISNQNWLSVPHGLHYYIYERLKNIFLTHLWELAKAQFSICFFIFHISDPNPVGG